MDKFINTLRSFIRDEEGAQVIEYALIIAVVSLGLVIHPAPTDWTAVSPSTQEG